MDHEFCSTGAATGIGLPRVRASGRASARRGRAPVGHMPCDGWDDAGTGSGVTARRETYTGGNAVAFNETGATNTSPGPLDV